MKTILIQGLIAFFPLVLASQAWSPIRVNQKMNYKHSDSVYVSHTIWVDSVAILAGDSILYLNRVVKDVQGNPEIALRNQPQFLLTRIHKNQNGIYTFELPDAFQFFTQAGVGEPWLLGTQNSLWANVESIIYENIFGTMDSVKYISLTDGSEIQLSKNFGFLKFPDFENDGYFELVGIQDSPYGVSVPGFWDIYNFEVGDVFQMSEYSMDPFGDGSITRKISITSKEMGDSSYYYEFDGIYYCLYFNSGGGGSVTSYTYSDDITYLLSINHPTNYFPNQLFLLPNSGSGYGTDRVFTKANIFSDPDNGIIHKHYGAKEESNILYDSDVYYELDEFSDTLFRFPYTSIIGDPCGLMGVGYASLLGETYKTSGCFEFAQERELTGCIKNGDTIGSITADSLLLVEIKANNSVKEGVFVFPNPANDIIHIHLQESLKGEEISFELRNFQGSRVIQNKLLLPHNQIDINHLPSGIYFYLIYRNKNLIQAKKIILR